MRIEFIKGQRVLNVGIEESSFSTISTKIKSFFNTLSTREYETFIEIIDEYLSEILIIQDSYKQNPFGLRFNIKKLKEKGIEIKVAHEHKIMDLYTIYTLLRMSDQPNEIKFNNWKIDTGTGKGWLNITREAETCY